MRKCQCGILLLILEAVRLAPQQHVLTFLYFACVGLVGRTLTEQLSKAFCMGDGHQLLPPVRWRGWRQHKMEASCVSASQMNPLDVICLAGGEELTREPGTIIASSGRLCVLVWSCIAAPLSSQCYCIRLHG